jgi:hypothetical protein
MGADSPFSPGIPYRQILSLSPEEQERALRILRRRGILPMPSLRAISLPVDIQDGARQDFAGCGHPTEDLRHDPRADVIFCLACGEEERWRLAGETEWISRDAMLRRIRKGG